MHSAIRVRQTEARSRKHEQDFRNELSLKNDPDNRNKLMTVSVAGFRTYQSRILEWGQIGHVSLSSKMAELWNVCWLH